MTTGVVLTRAGGTFRVHTPEGEVTAVLRGKLKQADDDRLVAGDIVELALHRDGPATVERVHTRRSVLARRKASGGRSLRRAQPIAANVDQVVVVTSARDPEPTPRMLDRMLVIAEANGIPAAIVVNKVELDRGVVDVLSRRFVAAGYQVLATSLKVPEGLPALR
ncbi:MAG TPA: GTPase RsgA, partial [Gemmatimonadales bacterium]